MKTLRINSHPLYTVVVMEGKTPEGEPAREGWGQARKILGPTVIAALVGAVIGAAIGLRHPQAVRFNLHAFLGKRTQSSLSPGMLLSIVMWVVFSLYWEAKAKGASEAKRSESRLSRGFHVTLVSLAQILIFFPVPGLRARFLPESTSLVVLGLSLQLIFFALAVWARQLLGRNWSGAVTTKLDHELVRSGPYRVVRHPIYTALLGVYVSTALVSGEIRGLVGVAIACIAYWRKIRMEEAYLGDLFGPAHESYRSDTWALIPGVW